MIERCENITLLYYTGDYTLVNWGGLQGVFCQIESHIVARVMNFSDFIRKAGW